LGLPRLLRQPQLPRRRRSEVKALVFRHNLAREAASAIGGRVDRRAFVSRIAPVRIEDVDELPLPASDWVRVQTTFSGLCGSDVKQILLNGSRDNPLTALVSFPHVLGHEVVGRRPDTGERGVLNPWLSCGPRGIDPPCPACRDGRYPWCRPVQAVIIPHRYPVRTAIGSSFRTSPAPLPVPVQGGFSSPGCYGSGAGYAGGHLWRIAAVDDRPGTRDCRVQAGRCGHLDEARAGNDRVYAAGDELVELCLAAAAESDVEPGRGSGRVQEAAAGDRHGQPWRLDPGDGDLPVTAEVQHCQ
jgi:hypothetical protein